MKKLLLAAVMTLALTQAHALDGNALLGSCDRGGDACYFYIIGVFEGLEWQQAIDKEVTKNSHSVYCMPGGVKYGQLEKVVHKYLQDNPAKLHEDTAILVTYAFSEAWPCK